MIVDIISQSHLLPRSFGMFSKLKGCHPVRRCSSRIGTIVESRNLGVSVVKPLFF
jgi:hypothetical protein